MKANPLRVLLYCAGLGLAGCLWPVPLEAAGEPGSIVVVQEPDTNPKSDFNRTVKAAMLDRIYTMVGIDAPKEDQLYRSLVKAYTLGQVVKIPLAPGGRDLPWDQIKELKAAFEQPPFKSMREDATAEFIVLGFADSADDSVENVYLSKARADFVKHVLRDNVGLGNVVFTLPMGGSPLFDPAKPAREYAVEIWVLGTWEHGGKRGAEVASGH
jgi:hypothetical protein